MSAWTGTAQAHLDAGLPANLYDLVYVVARRYDNGALEAVGFWTGAESISETIDGTPRIYIGVSGGLAVPEVVTQAGLEVDSVSVVLNGLNAVTESLRAEYDVDQAVVEIHQLLQTPGLATLGTRRLFRGTIDGASLQGGDGAGSLTTEGVSTTRRGTRAHSALRDESRDPFFKYASEENGDRWG